MFTGMMLLVALALSGVAADFSLRSYDCYVTMDVNNFAFGDCNGDSWYNSLVFKETTNGRLYTVENNANYYLPAIGNHMSQGPNGGSVKFTGSDSDGIWRRIVPETTQHGARGEIKFAQNPTQFTRKKDGKPVWGYALEWTSSGGAPFGKEHAFTGQSTIPAPYLPNEGFDIDPNLRKFVSPKEPKEVIVNKPIYPWWANNTALMFGLVLLTSVILNFVWILKATCFDCKLKTNKSYKKVIDEEEI